MISQPVALTKYITAQRHSLWEISVLKAEHHLKYHQSPILLVALLSKTIFDILLSEITFY